MAVKIELETMQLFFIVIFSVLALCSGAKQEGGCSKNMRIGDGGFGGWKQASDNEIGALLVSPMEVVLAAIQQHTDDQNDVLPESYADKVNIEEVYTQLVAGMNYCVVFRTSFCNTPKNGVECKNKEVKCETQVYVPIGYMQGGAPESMEVKSFSCE